MDKTDIHTFNSQRLYFMLLVHSSLRKKKNFTIFDTQPLAVESNKIPPKKCFGGFLENLK
jgi:hypothetical protein